MSELPASHRAARRLTRVYRNSYHAGSRSGHSPRSSPSNQPKAPLPWIARASLRPARSPVIPSAKPAFSRYQTPGGQRVEDGLVQLIEVGRRLAVDAGAGRPEHDLSRARVDQPVVLAAGQRVRDLLQVEATQVKHLARISLSRCPHSRIWNARAAAEECVLRTWRRCIFRPTALHAEPKLDLPGRPQNEIPLLWGA